MKNKTFVKCEKTPLVCVVQAATPDRIKELADKAISEGAEAFGMQFCKLDDKFRNRKTYKELFEYVSPLPTYVTNYRSYGSNKDKNDDALVMELVEIAECGATLCDVMGDYFDRCDDELTMNPDAIDKQIKLIDELHKRGAEVLMSSHVKKFIPAERVLEIALEHQRRGADVSKIVTGAATMEEQIENLRITNLLKEKLNIPFLFLSCGESYIVRRLGATFGNCMTLCVCEYDELATSAQPLLSDMMEIRKLFAANKD